MPLRVPILIKLTNFYYISTTCIKRSPKKLRELSDIHDLVKESIEFDASGIKPVKASGTHWIAHKVGALKKLLDKYSIYIIHLQSLCTDKSYSEKEKSKLEVSVCYIFTGLLCMSKKRTCETRNNVFYFTMKALFFLEIIKF